MNKKLAVKDIIDMMDKTYTLIYIDRDCNFNNSPEVLQRCIRDQSDVYLYDDVFEWVEESEWDSVDTIIENLMDEAETEFDLTRKETLEFFKDNNEEIEEEIYARDDSDVVQEMLKNTSYQVMFYDTGLELYGGGGEEELKQIKDTLSITDNSFDKTIRSLLAEASYGGQLVVYFTCSPDELMGLGSPKSITFRNASIAIIDTENGSGSDEELNGHTFSLPFVLDNLFVEKSIKYNYTFEVCGMSSDWCQGTYVSISEEEMNETVKVNASPINAHMEQEQRFNVVYKQGKCSSGDMDMRRHRETYYINDFPCGTKCKNCLTFWVD